MRQYTFIVKTYILRAKIFLNLEFYRYQFKYVTLRQWAVRSPESAISLPLKHLQALSCIIPYVLHRHHVFTVGLQNKWHNADTRHSDFIFRFILLCPSSGTKLCFSHHLVYVQLTERARLSRVPYTRQPWEKKLEPDDRNTNATEIYKLNPKSKTDWNRKTLSKRRTNFLWT